MIHYVIDGNNLVGKSKKLSDLQKKDKLAVREKLIYMLERYFTGKNLKVTLHFDGYQGRAVKTSLMKIQYSENKTADEKIKQQIDQNKNRKNIILVTSDQNLIDYGRACSCGIMLSEKFEALLSGVPDSDEEKKRIDEINDTDLFKKLFGA